MCNERNEYKHRGSNENAFHSIMVFDCRGMKSEDVAFHDLVLVFPYEVTKQTMGVLKLAHMPSHYASLLEI